MRVPIILTAAEKGEAKWLPTPRDVWEFWGKVAIRRGFDPDTVLSINDKATALPLGHGKHWCYPLDLQCKRRSLE